MPVLLIVVGAIETVLKILEMGIGIVRNQKKKVCLYFLRKNIYIYIVLFGPFKPELGVIPKNRLQMTLK